MTDYSRFQVYATELDFDLECRDCLPKDWWVGTFSVRYCSTLQDMMNKADEHRAEVHAEEEG